MCDSVKENLQLLLALQSFTVSFRSLFSCPGLNFTDLVHSQLVVSFLVTASCCGKAKVQCTVPAQTHTLSDQLVNTVEHLASK